MRQIIAWVGAPLMRIPIAFIPPASDESVRRSEERFRALVSASSPIVWTTTATGEVVEDIVGWTAFTGQRFEEMKGKGWFHAIHPDDLQRVRALWRAAIEERAAVQSEYRLRRHDGVYRTIIAFSVPVLEPDGSIREWVGTCTDITEQRRAESLKAGQARVLELLATGKNLDEVLTALIGVIESQCEGVCGSVVLLDVDGRHIHCKAAPSLPAGYCRALEGLPIGPEAGSCGTAIFRGKPIITPDIQSDPLWANYRDLAARFGLKACWSQPIFSSERKVLGSFALYPQECRGPDESEARLIESAAHLAGIAIDHYHAHAALHQAKEAAESANRAKDDFLATISHELRTPIGAVLLWSKLLKAGTLSEEQGREAIERIVTCAEDQSQVVNDLLDVSHVLHGTMAVNMRPIDLGEVVRAAVETQRLATQTKGIALDVQAPPMPATGDAVRLRQMVFNLVTNAVKFTPPGGRVDVRLWARDHEATLQVADTGEGIIPEYLPNLFSRFSQADTSITRRHGGLGLGLAIVKTIAELHGGTVRAQSEGAGRGATFEVTLPLESAGQH
ncbi:MAG: multi-sensor hybrid histidine kinase [Phycisphaerales bacterium]|nr:multi-sensor hybrid histidine kinase [Phycisphaerales bacterium]